MDVTYLDHNATTPLPEELLREFEVIARKTVGNPSSPHSLGRLSRRLIDQALEAIVSQVRCDKDEIYFTSGASESNSWILQSIVKSTHGQGRKPRILTTTIEHDSLLLAANRSGADLGFAEVLPSGQINLAHYEELLSETAGWDLVSIVHVNNETGVIQPVEQIIEKARALGVPVHLDCAQSLGKIPLNLKTLGPAYATFSGHKIGAPKGVGFTVIQRASAAKGPPLEALIYGKQQREFRGGTLNTFGIAMLGRALELFERAPPFPTHLKELHERFENELKKKINGVVIHGENAPRVPNTSFVGFLGIDGNSVLSALDLAGICASSGSACSSGTLAPSHVLTAMGCPRELARSSIRFSSGRTTTWPDFDRALEVLPQAVNRVRSSLRN